MDGFTTSPGNLYLMNILTRWLANRARTRRCTTVVLHATAGRGVAGAISTLLARRLSYHYLVDKEGEITKCVPTGRVAFHAGKSFGPEGAGVNDYSIGISMVNLNDGIDPYPAKQVEATRQLVETLVDAIPDLHWITTHRQISWPRKSDPAGFPASAVRSRLVYFRRAGVPD